MKLNSRSTDQRELENVNKMTSSYGSFNRKQYPLGSKTNDDLLYNAVYQYIFLNISTMQTGNTSQSRIMGHAYLRWDVMLIKESHMTFGNWYKHKKFTNIEIIYS